MKFAVIKTGGKQYRVKPGDVLMVEKLTQPEKGSEITFDAVLLTDDGKVTKIGKEVKANKVTATILAQGRAPKLHIIKFKAKSNYHKKQGHRQPFTKVKIEEIK